MPELERAFFQAAENIFGDIKINNLWDCIWTMSLEQ